MEYEDSFISNITSIPTLQQLASIQVVLPLWNQYFSQSKKMKFSSLERFDRLHPHTTDLSKMVKSLETAAPIEERLMKSLYKILHATAEWAEHFNSDEFLWYHTLQVPHISNPNPDWCVWLSKGEIDYKNSAVRIISSPELSEAQKFATMCTYCMEPQIKTFDLSLLPAHFIKNVNFQDEKLIAYWLFYLKKKLHEISAGVSGSLEATLALNCDNELAFEYFWNRLGEEDQISVAKSKLNCSDNDEYSYYCQKRLFSLMSWPQQRRLLAEIPDVIILNFWLKVRSPKLVRWAWKHSKNGMTVKQFARVVKEVFHQRNGYEEEMELLIDLWDTAPDRLKIYAAKEMVNAIVKPSLFGKYLELTDYLASCDENSTMDSWEDAAMKSLRKESALKFLCKFLSLKNAAERRQLMLKNATEFAVNVRDPQLMNELITLCLPNSNDQLIFKKSILNSPAMKKHCGEMLSRRNGFKNYKLKLNFYSPDVKVAKEFTKEILLSKFIDRSIFLKNFSYWTEASEFIDENFADNPSLATSIKKEFVSNFAPKFQLHWTDEDQMTEMFKILEHVYTAKELSAVKQRLLKACKSQLTNRSHYLSYFDKNRFIKLVSWCVGDGDKLVKFKKSFPIDDMFNRTINEINDTYNNDSDFDDNLLNKFGDLLEWYFANPEELKKFKLRKLETLDLKNLTMFEYFLDLDEDDYCLKTLLSWFYDHESVSEEVLREFKAKIKEST